MFFFMGLPFSNQTWFAGKSTSVRSFSQRTKAPFRSEISMLSCLTTVILWVCCNAKGKTWRNPQLVCSTKRLQEIPKKYWPCAFACYVRIPVVAPSPALVFVVEPRLPHLFVWVVFHVFSFHMYIYIYVRGDHVYIYIHIYVYTLVYLLLYLSIHLFIYL